MSNKICQCPATCHHEEINQNKKIFSEFLNRFVEKHVFIVGLIKRVNSIAKATISTIRDIATFFIEISYKIKIRLQTAEKGFKVFGGALTALLAPVHVYNVGKSGVSMMRELFKKNVSSTCEQSAKFILNVVCITDDAAIIASVLATLKLIPKPTWTEPLGLITGSLQCIGLILNCMDLYRVIKFKKYLNKINTKNRTNVTQTMSYILDDKNLAGARLSLGIEPKKILEVLEKKILEEDRKKVVRLLNLKINYKILSTVLIALPASAIGLIAIAISIIAFGILILFPALPLVKEIATILKVSASFLMWGTSIVFLCKFMSDLLVDYKFKLALARCQTSENGLA